MESLEGFSNADLLARLTGKNAAAALLERYGGLTNLAQASLDELQFTKGVGRSRAAAIRAAFLLAQRLAQEIPTAPPLMECLQVETNYRIAETTNPFWELITPKIRRQIEFQREWKTVTSTLLTLELAPR